MKTSNIKQAFELILTFGSVKNDPKI